MNSNTTKFLAGPQYSGFQDSLSLVNTSLSEVIRIAGIIEAVVAAILVAVAAILLIAEGNSDSGADLKTLVDLMSEQVNLTGEIHHEITELAITLDSVAADLTALEATTAELAIAFDLFAAANLELTADIVVEILAGFGLVEISLSVNTFEMTRFREKLLGVNLAIGETNLGDLSSLQNDIISDLAALSAIVSTIDGQTAIVESVNTFSADLIDYVSSSDEQATLLDLLNDHIPGFTNVLELQLAEAEILNEKVATDENLLLILETNLEGFSILYEPLDSIDKAISIFNNSFDIMLSLVNESLETIIEQGIYLANLLTNFIPLISDILAGTNAIAQEIRDLLL